MKYCNENSNESIKIVQVDGNESIEIESLGEDSDDNSTDDVLDSTQYETDEEALSDPIPANLHPVPNQTIFAGKPIKLDINKNVS